MADQIVVIDNDTFNLVTEGIQGPAGAQGPQGDGILLLGAVALVGDLPSSNNTAGDAYMVGTNLYVWSGSAWVNTGDIKGDTGAAGPGVPSGGTSSQSLIKLTNTSYDTGWATLDKTYVGLDNVDNTADIDKPLSTATTAALGSRVAMTGIPVDSSGAYLTTLSYNETTRTVTISPTGTTFDVFVQGVRYTKTGAQEIVHNNLQGAHFIYFDATGTLVTSTSPWDILLHAPVCYVFWDVTNSLGIPFDERHHAGRDLYWHRNQHSAEGTKATGSGFAAGGYTLANGANDTFVTYSVASGRVEDEDIRIDTQALPDAGPYTILYRSGVSGDWQITRSSVRPFLDSGSALQYNNYTGGTWQRSTVTEDYYVNYWVFALTALPTTSITPAPTATQQIVIIPGQVVHATEALATSESVSGLSFGTMPFAEMAPLYQVTLKYNASGAGSYNNTAKCAIIRLQRIVGSSVTISSAVQSDHGALTGLVDDDHPQYALSTSGSTRAEIDLGASPTNGYVLAYSSGTGRISPVAVSGAPDYLLQAQGVI